ncbi:hypothetical protein CspHIS471_0104800 [Cutaneotrichosporon sp. HIS471]|nr:hypothetical protein CspHIS471_0104800 [Cutaneotrichosporon sp. HIS471]
MHNDEKLGPSAEAPSPDPQPRGTLAALWGQPGQLQFSKEKEKAPQRKRRKKDDVPQGRLVFGADGMSVATPPPPPPPPPENGEEKKGRKRKTDVPGEATAAKPGRKRGRPPKNAQLVTSAPSPSYRRIELSPDSVHAISESDPDPDVIFTGGTPSASQVRQLRGTGEAHDPVEVDDMPRAVPRRKNIVFSSDNNQTHAFFGRRPPDLLGTFEVSEAGSGAVTPATGAATAPPSGRATPKATNGALKKAQVHAFFSNGGKPTLGTLKDGWGNCREGDEPASPLPGGEWPNHLGMAEAGPFALTTVSRRERPTVVEEDTYDTFWQDVLTRARSPRTPSPTPSPMPMSAPPFILEHPAIAAVLSNNRPDDGRETWCERTRPREAGAVLGNELEAAYLRDWLEALSIGQAESCKVIRRVPRQKMVNPDLCWIVDDIGLFGEPAAEVADEELPEPYEEPYLGPGQRPNSYPPLGAFVGNTIVLTGPSGTGKSAAVHAVATELGWDVFEVYPGIGKRTGPQMVNLVGDVSKNHTVGSRDKKKSAAAAAMAMFANAAAKQKVDQPALGSQGSAHDPIELEEDPPSASESSAETSAAKAKQSLILIDEADILFDEASTFWPAVVSLIAESRRPVVITCNDLASVPTDILPLQVILHFRAAPSCLAQPYLASIAQKHGFSCDVARLFKDCSRPCLPDLVQQPLPPNGNEPEERFDLRAALMQMQLDRQSACERRRHCGVRHHSLGDIGTLTRQLDAESYADAFVAPRPWARQEISEGDRFVPTADDQDGVRLVYKPDVQDLHPVLAAYDAAADVAAALVESAGGGLHRNLRQLHYDQTSYIRGLLPFLDPLIPLTAQLLPHRSLFLDVVPIVRSIVIADDAFEMADRAAVANGEARINPRTGRAMRTTVYERWFNLGLEGRTAAVESGLVLADG